MREFGERNDEARMTNDEWGNGSFVIRHSGFVILNPIRNPQSHHARHHRHDPYRPQVAEVPCSGRSILSKEVPLSTGPGGGEFPTLGRNISCFEVVPAMDLNRNQFFFLGLVVLLIGVQIRCVSAYVLNPEATQFIAERTGQPAPQSAAMSFFGAASGSNPAVRKVVQPPEWLGWCLISVGSVLILHSLAMRKPD